MAVYKITAVHPDSAWYKEKDAYDNIVGTVIKTTKDSLIYKSIHLAGWKTIREVSVLIPVNEYLNKGYIIGHIFGVKLKKLSV